MEKRELVSNVSYMGGMNYSLLDDVKIMQQIIDGNYDMHIAAKYADQVCINNHKNIMFL